MGKGGGILGFENAQCCNSVEDKKLLFCPFKQIPTFREINQRSWGEGIKNRKNEKAEFNNQEIARTSP
jgi:hypothetical protein